LVTLPTTLPCFRIGGFAYITGDYCFGWNVSVWLNMYRLCIIFVVTVFE